MLCKFHKLCKGTPCESGREVARTKQTINIYFFMPPIMQFSWWHHRNESFSDQFSYNISRRFNEWHRPQL